MIIDCFMFYNELDILKIRLYELYNVVDFFVLVEATTTHTGDVKPLYYSENKDIFSEYNDKIIHIVTDFNENYDFSNHINAPTQDWFRENYQRECIQSAFNTIGITNEDIIILCDVDEIPKKILLENIKKNDLQIENDKIYSIEMSLYYYNIELTTHRKWYHSKIFNYFTYKNNNLLTHIRLSGNNNTLFDGGWHLSYFGDENFIKNKVESFAESTEYLIEKKNINYLKECLDNCVLHFNNEKLIHIPLSTNNNVPSFYRIL